MLEHKRNILEIRISKSETNMQKENTISNPKRIGFGTFSFRSFGFISKFGIRVSDFHTVEVRP